VARYDFTPEQVREATRIAVLFFTGKEPPQESPQESRKQESPQERSPQERSPHPAPLFAAPESIRT